MGRKKTKRKINWLDHAINFLVVVIGVSIAFYASNWKQGSDRRQLEIQTCESLIQELESDIASLGSIVDTSKNILKYNIKLSSAITNKDYNNDSLLHFLLSLYSYSQFTPNDVTFETIKSDPSVIGDFEIKKQIITLYKQHYGSIAIMDDYHRTLQFDQIQPFIQQHVRFGATNTIVDKGFMQQTLFANLSFASSYALSSKINIAEKVLEDAKTLKEELKNYQRSLQ